MKTNTTEQSIKSLSIALKTIGSRLFDCKSCDPKSNAQRNLSSLTHYCDDESLRFHKSRINTSGTLFSGLVFFIGGTDALDMNNTKRGHRFAAWDVFGNMIYRPDLESAFKTESAARKHFDSFEIDIAKHYSDEINRLLEIKKAELAKLQDVVSFLGGKTN